MSETYYDAPARQSEQPVTEYCLACGAAEPGCDCERELAHKLREVERDQLVARLPLRNSTEIAANYRAFRAAWDAINARYARFHGIV